MSAPRGRVLNGSLLARLAPVAAVVAAALLVSFPTWLTASPAGSDTVFHASWQRHFSQQFWSGEFYPRWLAGMNQGLGSPAFFYYAPLPYHLTSLLGALVPAGDYGLRHLAYGTALSFVASGLACYLWLRQFSGRSGAAAGAILYLLAPYHSIVNPYMRGAYSELWAFAFMPLVLYFARRVVAARNSRVGFAGLSLSYTLLACTHLPAVVVFSAVPAIYAYFITGRKIAAVLRTLAGVAFGAGLAGIYLLPALTMQPAASFRDMLADRYFERWVTFERANAHDLYGLLLWSVLTSAALIICAAILAQKRRTTAGEDAASTVEASSTVRRDTSRVELIFWIITAALSIFLMTFASDPVWRLIPILQKVQFPWRFQLVLCLAVAGACAAGICLLRSGFVSMNRRALLFASLLVACWLYLWAGAALRTYPELPRPNRLSDELVRSLDRSRDAPEYRPALALSNAERDIETLLQNLCGDLRREPRACVSEGEGTVTVTRAAPRSLEFRTESATGITFRVSQFHFPGWTASLNGRPHILAAARPDGLLLVSVPAGVHDLRLTLEPTMPERLGLLISIASALFLVLLSARSFLTKLMSRRGRGDSRLPRDGVHE